MCEPEGPAAYRFPRPARWRRSRSHVVLASPPLGACLSDESECTTKFGQPEALVANRRKMVIRQGVAGKEEGSRDPPPLRSRLIVVRASAAPLGACEVVSPTELT